MLMNFIEVFDRCRLKKMVENNLDFKQKKNIYDRVNY